MALHCSKDDGARLIRKMIIEGILVEETQRQDNQYASLVAKLRLNPTLVSRLESGALKLSMPFATKAVPHAKKGKKAAVEPEKQQVSLSISASLNTSRYFCCVRGIRGR